jgi:hypothetical protein
VAVIILQYKKERSEDMFRQLYMYLVLFVTLMMTIKGTVMIFNNMADLVSPEPYYENFSSFKYNEITMAREQKLEIPSEAEMKQRFDEGEKLHYEQVKRGAVKDIIRSLGWIVVPLPLFIYFQLLIRREWKNIAKSG